MATLTKGTAKLYVATMWTIYYGYNSTFLVRTHWIWCTVPWLAQNIAFAGFPLNQLMFEWYSEVETRSLLISRECHGHFSKFYLADWVKIENQLNFITVRVLECSIWWEHNYQIYLSNISSRIRIGNVKKLAWMLDLNQAWFNPIMSYKMT